LRFLAVLHRHSRRRPWAEVTDAADPAAAQLECGPTYAHDERLWSNPDCGRDVYTHYGLPYGGGV
jgi:hypothetical protein